MQPAGGKSSFFGELLVEDCLRVPGIGYYHKRRDENRNVDLGSEHDWSSQAADEIKARAAGFRELTSQTSG